MSKLLWALGLGTVAAGGYGYYKAANNLQISFGSFGYMADGVTPQITLKVHNPSTFFSITIPPFNFNIFDSNNNFLGTASSTITQGAPANSTSILYAGINANAQSLLQIALNSLTTGSLPIGITIKGNFQIGPFSIPITDTISISGTGTKYTIAPSDIHGNGVFATAFIEPGEYIGKALTYTKYGPIITPYLGKWMNHCPSANCMLIAKGDEYHFHAITDILPGEEIMLDYSQNPAGIKTVI